MAGGELGLFGAATKEAGISAEFRIRCTASRLAGRFTTSGRLRRSAKDHESRAMRNV